MNKRASLFELALVHAALGIAAAFALYPLLWVVTLALSSSRVTTS